MSTGSETNELRNIILNFRVSELQVLLGFAGRNKSGKKQELQQRALDLLRVRSTPIIVKIKELHRRSAGRYASEMESVLSRSTVGGLSSLASGLDAPLGSSSSLGGIPQSRICAVPPMKRDDPTPSQQNHINLLQRHAAAALGASGLYNFPMAQVASALNATATPYNQFPIHPDVRLKVLPFYEQLAEILKPSSLQQNIPPQQSSQHSQRCKEAEFAFHMTPHQVHMLLMSKDYKPGEAAVQLQLRFCALDSTVPQDDVFPPGLIVKVNGRNLALPNAIPTNKPGVEPKRPPKPLNITTLCHTNTNLPNKLHVTWNHEYGKAFVCAVYLVQRHNANALLDRLKKKGRMSVEMTKNMIRKKLSPEGDDDICLTSIRVTLVCPLGQCRVQIPCRPSGCSHINCFDASFYLMMNEKKPTWICAVCCRNISFEDLYIDAYMEEVCRNAPPECREVEFKEDGSWVPVMEDKDDPSKKRKRSQAASDSDDSDTEREKKETKQEKEVMIDLTESTDEEDNVCPPAAPPRSHGAHQPTTQRQPHTSMVTPSQRTYGGSLQQSSSSSANPLSNSRTVAPSIVGAASRPAWPTNYPAAVASGTSSAGGGYYGSAYTSSDYFNQAAAAVAAGAPSVGQNLYATNPYGSYDIYQLLVDERSQMQQRSHHQAGSGGPRDVINLD